MRRESGRKRTRGEPETVDSPTCSAGEKKGVGFARRWSRGEGREECLFSLSQNGGGGGVEWWMAVVVVREREEKGRFRQKVATGNVVVVVACRGPLPTTTCTWATLKLASAALKL